MSDVYSVPGPSTVLVCIMCFIAAANASATLSFIVNSPEDLPDANPGDGLAIATNGHTTLRAAIEEANAQPGEVYITFSVALYQRELPALIYIDSPLHILDDVSIVDNPSRRNGVLCRIRGGSEYFRVLEVAAGVKLLMHGLIWQWQNRPGEPYPDRGGMMYCHPGSEVTLIGGELRGGVAAVAGGAVYLDHATLLRKSGTITGYCQGDGGSIYCDRGTVIGTSAGVGRALGRGGSIYNNSGTILLNATSTNARMGGGHSDIAGGAVYSDGGTVILRKALLRNNSAAQGGAIYLTGGAQLDVIACHIRSNESTGQGGAIYVDSGIARFSMCTISDNHAGGAGGAAYLAGGTATFIGCTIRDNSAGMGGGIAIAAPALCQLGNTIIAGNSVFGATGWDIAGTFLSLGHNLFGIHNGGHGFAATDLTGTSGMPLDPGLQFLSNHGGTPDAAPGAYIPLPGSPAIDAGDNALLFHPDFAGGACFDMRQSCCPRVRGAAVDIGAIEVQEGEIGLECTGTHSADYDRDGRFNLSELLRAIQLFRSGEYHCASWSEDGFDIGPGDQDCAPHSADYAPQDWRISLREILRLIQLYNSGGYHFCPDEGTEDGFCPGAR